MESNSTQYNAWIKFVRCLLIGYNLFSSISYDKATISQKFIDVEGSDKTKNGAFVLLLYMCNNTLYSIFSASFSSIFTIIVISFNWSHRNISYVILRYLLRNIIMIYSCGLQRQYSTYAAVGRAERNNFDRYNSERCDPFNKVLNCTLLWIIAYINAKEW